MTRRRRRRRRTDGLYGGCELPRRVVCRMYTAYFSLANALAGAAMCILIFISFFYSISHALIPVVLILMISCCRCHYYYCCHCCCHVSLSLSLLLLSCITITATVIIIYCDCPRLVILDGSTGEVKSLEGRGDVTASQKDPSRAVAQWQANEVVTDMGGGGWCNIL